jgi:hypothetical protein
LKDVRRAGRWVPPLGRTARLAPEKPNSSTDSVAKSDRDFVGHRADFAPRGVHENHALPLAGDRVPDHLRADGARPDWPGVCRGGEQRRGPWHPPSTILPSADLSRGNPPRSETHRQAVRREPAAALPRRGPGGRLSGRARPHPLALLGRSDTVRGACPRRGREGLPPGGVPRGRREWRRAAMWRGKSPPWPWSHGS